MHPHLTLLLLPGHKSNRRTSPLQFTVVWHWIDFRQWIDMKCPFHFKWTMKRWIYNSLNYWVTYQLRVYLDFHHQLPLFEFPWTDGTFDCAVLFFFITKPKIMTVAQRWSQACISKELGILPRRLQITEQVSLSQGNMRYLLSTKVRKWGVLPDRLNFFFLNTGASPATALCFSAKLNQETKGSVGRKWAVALAGCCFWPIVWFLRTSCRYFTF